MYFNSEQEVEEPHLEFTLKIDSFGPRIITFSF